MTTSGILLIGTEGADSLSGTAGDDTLFGGAGQDTLRGGEGNDLLLGGAGRNLVDGGAGNDIIAVSLQSIPLDSNANETLIGGEGDDLFLVPLTGPAFLGGIADPAIEGGGGTDTIAVEAFGQAEISIATLNFTSPPPGGARLQATGIENVLVSGGFVTVTGGEADNFIAANTNAASVFGGAGDDIIITGAGHDLVHGGADADFLIAGAGNDTLDGGDDGDVLAGGAGADLFRFDDGGGLDMILDFSRAQGDKIAIAAGINGSGIADPSQLPRFSGPDGTLVYLGEQAGIANWIAVVGVTDLSADDFVIV